VTIQTEFYNWQNSDLDWSKPPWNDCSVNLIELDKYMRWVWGGRWLGCHLDRSIIDGSTPSSHAYGSGYDWGWDRMSHSGPGRTVVDEIIIPWLIAHSRELGLQAIHDYQRSRIWRPPGTSGRPADGDGWRIQPKGSQMGQDWARWLHLETHLNQWANGTPIADRFKESDVPIEVKNGRVFDSRANNGQPFNTLHTVQVNLRSKVPASAKAVLVQVAAIRPAANGFMTVWGSGPRPESSVLNYAAGVNAIAGSDIVFPDANGRILVYTHGGGHVKVDVSAYWE